MICFGYVTVTDKAIITVLGSMCNSIPRIGLPQETGAGIIEVRGCIRLRLSSTDILHIRVNTVFGQDMETLQEQ